MTRLIYGLGFNTAFLELSKLLKTTYLVLCFILIATAIAILD
jgi:hypothetical protein